MTKETEIGSKARREDDEVGLNVGRCETRCPGCPGVAAGSLAGLQTGGKGHGGRAWSCVVDSAGSHRVVHVCNCEVISRHKTVGMVMKMVNWIYLTPDFWSSDQRLGASTRSYDALLSYHKVS